MPDISSFTDGSSFVILFDSSERIRILDVFLGSGSIPVSPACLSNLAEVPEPELDSHLTLLEEIDVITPAEDTEGSYRLDESSDFVEHLREAHLNLLDYTQQLQAHRNR